MLCGGPGSCCGSGWTQEGKHPEEQKGFSLFSSPGSRGCLEVVTLSKLPSSDQGLCFFPSSSKVVIAVPIS